MTGVSSKPDLCKDCPYYSIGAGFVADEYPSGEPKIAMWLEAPGADEILYGRPLWGKAGKLWERQLLEPLGLARSDILIVNTLRCRPPGNKYPIGKLRKEVEIKCRQYDTWSQAGDGVMVDNRGIGTWNPDTYVITEHPASILHSGAIGKLRLLRAHIKRAVAIADCGCRPCVVMGRVAFDLLWPGLSKHGGLRAWAGHYFTGRWKKLEM